MKIAYVYIVDLRLRSASVNQTLNMCNEFASLADVTFVSSWIKPSDFELVLSELSLSKKFKHKPMPIVWRKYSKYLEKPSRMVYCLLALLEVLRKDYDLIFTRDFSFMYLLSLLPDFMRPKQPIVYEPHKIYSKSLPNVDFETEKKALNVASLFVPTTVGAKEDLLHLFGFDEGLLYQHANGVNLQNFNAVQYPGKLLSKKYPVTKGKKVLVYTGSFLGWKGVDVLIKSIKHIKQEDFVLVLMGAEAQILPEMEKLVRCEGIEDKVVLNGFKPQKEVIAALKSADIGVIPNISDPEGDKYTSPLKAYEYMACGLPIVVSDLFSMRQILKEDVNAVYFEPGNERQLAEKIDLLLNDASLRKRLSDNNLEEAPNHTWKKRAEKVMGFVQSRLPGLAEIP